LAGKIFINYRRDDSAPHAMSIAQYLERRFGSQNVFIDVDHIRAGENFVTVLDERLQETKVQLVIIGPRWTEARNSKRARRLDDPEDWVRMEITSALRKRIRVIPVLVGGAKLPKEDLLPDDLKPLLKMQAAIITTASFRHEMAGLANDIEGMIGRDYRSYGQKAAIVGASGLMGIALLYALISAMIPSERTEGRLSKQCEADLQKFRVAVPVGAFAVASNGNCGVSVGQPKISLARVAALEACNKVGQGCKIFEVLEGDWTLNSDCEQQLAAWRNDEPAKAFAVSKSGHCATSIAQKSLDEAKTEALADCEAQAGECRLRESNAGNWEMNETCTKELDEWRKKDPVSAFAVARNGTCGSSSGYSSAEDARKNAISDCETDGSECKVTELFEGNWAVTDDCKPDFEKWGKYQGRGAFAVGRSGSCGYSWEYSSSAEADRGAIEECEKGGGDSCKVISRK